MQSIEKSCIGVNNVDKNIYIVPRYEDKKGSIYIYITSKNRKDEELVLIKDMDIYQILNLISDLCEVLKEIQREKSTTNGH